MKERANDDDGDGDDDTTLVALSVARGGVPERVQDYDMAWARNHRILAGQDSRRKVGAMSAFYTYFRLSHGNFSLKEWVNPHVLDSRNL